MNRHIVFLLLAAALFIGASVLFSACGTQQDAGTADRSAGEPSEEVPEETSAGEEAPETVAVQTAYVDNIEMKYVCFGHGDKTMVILPGLSIAHVTNSADGVAAAFSRFADEFTIYLFDVQEDVPDGLTVSELSENTAAVMKSLGLKDVCLYGASMGGMQSIYIAGTYPELVSKLMLGSSSCRWNETSNECFTNWVRLAEEDTVALVADMVDHVYSEATVAAYGEYLNAGSDNIDPAELTRFIHTAKLLIDMDVSEQLAAVQCPVLAIGCLGDRVLTAPATEEIAEISGCEYYLYGEEYGHAVYDEAPDFLDHMEAFFIG